MRVLDPDDSDVDAVLATADGGWLYAVVAVEVRRIKIGRTKDLWKRVDSLQTGSPCFLQVHSVTLSENAPYDEAAAHAQLAHARIEWSREWFDLLDPAVDRWLVGRELDRRENGVFDRWERQVAVRASASRAKLAVPQTRPVTPKALGESGEPPDSPYG